MSGKNTPPISATTRYCAVFGHPIKHSASPAMQNAGIAALGLDWRYLAFEVRPDDLRAAIAGAQAMHFIGLNLTVPHKLLALKMVEELDDSARQWGAVNTICFEGRDARGLWRPLARLSETVPSQVRAKGFNTDAEAIATSLREDLKMELRGASVLLLGAGGAGRVAALKLAACGVKRLYLVNRTRSRAVAVARELVAHRRLQVEVGYPEGPIDLLVNATSLGLKPTDVMPLDGRQFSLKNAGAVYDMIYRPAETSLLRAARRAGCRVANGLGMLLHQGAAALEIWTGQKAPLDIMRRALEKNVYG